MKQFDIYRLNTRSVGMLIEMMNSAADYNAQNEMNEAREYRIQREIEGIREKIEHITQQINAYEEALDFATEKVLFCEKEGRKRSA